ncbi:sugar ABC transporter permease [Demequina sp. TTPB684]|uniref:multiple monosaccharide ABC transporter permease n=1 Tax=unclassified Demequina TaxID=2620311 RepID=UPI001CF2C42A|nr:MULTISPECIES: multiple monosaccharide ABC transporter permease [unclassified Demequina]MCB2411920.1 sugar ABC transporter permease [Demequina sp. TTPB684]UPU87644.1 sugar ABC transporter permease [Demequina sp. TMPB413]
MNSFKSLFGGDVRQFTMLGALVALLLFFQVMTNGKVLTPTNMVNLINGNSYVLILAIGMVMVIVVGHIDLSVGSVAAVTGIIVAMAIRDWGIPWWMGMLLGLGVGAAIGAWQGWWVAYVGIPGFITTLAGMMLFRGVNQYIGKSNSVPVPDEFQFIGAGYLGEWGPNTGLNNSTLLLGILAAAYVVWHELKARKKAIRIGAQPQSYAIAGTRAGLLILVIAYITYLFGSGRVGTSFPVPGLLLVGLVILYHVLTQRTVIGRHIFAVGGNRVAASLSGVSTKRTYFFVMMNMSILAAVAGMVFIGRSTASGPFDGNMWELDAIAAVFIGGAAVSGGIGTVTGSIIGGLVMATLNNGLQLMGVGSDRTQIIKGLVLLLAVAFDVYNKQQGRPSIIGHLFRSRPALQDSVDGEAGTPATVGLRTEAAAGAGAKPATAAVQVAHPTADAQDKEGRT